MRKIEADIWNFLIFWCHGHNAAHLPVIWNWLPAHHPNDITDAIEGLLHKRTIIVTRFGFLPMVSGKPYSNAKKNNHWAEFPTNLMVSAPEVLH